MKKEKFSVLITSSLEDLKGMLTLARVELLRIRMSVKTGKEKNTSKYSLQKKQVAQLCTAIRLKEISEVLV